MIESERVYLRSWRETDLEALYSMAKDDRVGPITGWPAHKSLEDSEFVLKNVLMKEGNYAVCLKSNDTVIGSFGIMDKNDRPEIDEDEIEIGFWLGVDYWGNGYIPEISKAVIDYQFTNLNVKGVWCGFYEGNAKSQRAQEKMGFKLHHKKIVHCALLDEDRMEYFNYLSKDDWLKNK